MILGPLQRLTTEAPIGNDWERGGEEGTDPNGRKLSGRVALAKALSFTHSVSGTGIASGIEPKDESADPAPACRCTSKEDSSLNISTPIGVPLASPVPGDSIRPTVLNGSGVDCVQGCPP